VTPSTATSAFDVFLSYHSGDADWVARLKTALERHALSVWLDREQIRPGDLFPGRLAGAIGKVRCVVVVLSPGAISSQWVEEEYNLALAHRCHTIAVLVDDVEPPGFLAGRTWVDFRDEDAFDASLVQLVFGITGQRPSDALALSAPAYREVDAVTAGTDEAEVLKRLIERSRENARPLWRARIASAVSGGLIGAIFLIVAGDANLLVRIAVCVMSPLTLSLAAWGVTTTGLTRIHSKVEQFELLRDGLEACRSRSHPGCKRLRQHFWDMMTRAAADITARPV
jgi:hypothetical protein